MSALRPPTDLDARYRPFLSLPEWADRAVGTGVFDAANALWADQRRGADDDLVGTAVQFAVRAAAFDTGAIEGLYTTDRGVTFSVAIQAAAWESIAQEAGRDAVRHFAAQLRAFDLVLDAATRQERITAAWLRALHETICDGQDTYRALTAVGWQDLPLPKGRFKNQPNHVLQPAGTWHPYAPVDLTQSEVQRLVDEINSSAFEAAHPVVQAAYVHHVLVGIHPFADGNGRVARALSSVFLYRAASVPLLIFADERPRYLAALRAADDGGRTALVTFVRDATIDAIELVSQRLRAGQRGLSDDVLSQLSSLSVPWTEEEATLAAARVVTTLREALRDHAKQVPPEAASVQLTTIAAADQAFRGYSGDWVRSASSQAGVLVTIASPRFRSLHLSREAAVLLATDLAQPHPIVVWASGGSVPLLRIRREAVHPVLGAATRLRIQDWADELLGDALRILADRAQEAAQPIADSGSDR